MEYNTQRDLLSISEYGRNIQKMIEYACQVENKEERNKMAKTIVRIMAQMTPQSKDITDYEQRLWNHLIVISDYKLDVDAPFPKPDPAEVNKKPERVPYSNHKIKYKPYGYLVELLIKKAVETEEGPARVAFTESLANLMKKSYLSWNRDSVNDIVIFNHLKELSGGKLTLRPDFCLDDTNQILARNKKKKKNVPGKHNPGAHKFKKKQ